MIHLFRSSYQGSVTFITGINFYIVSIPFLVNHAILIITMIEVREALFHSLISFVVSDSSCKRVRSLMIYAGIVSSLSFWVDSRDIKVSNKHSSLSIRVLLINLPEKSLQNRGRH